MDKILAESANLTPALLVQDEDSYNTLATTVANKLSGTIPPSAASKSTLDALTPNADTIPYLFIVATAIKAATTSGKSVEGQLPRSLLPEGELWPYITGVLLNFDPIQARYAGHPLASILDIVSQGAEQTQNYIPAIQLLANVILRLDPTSSTFTSTHYDFIRLCLLAGAYLDALPIITKHIYHIPVTDKTTESRSARNKCSRQESNGGWLTQTSGLTYKITSRMFLEYNSMCALCHMALGQYQQAIVFLEITLVAPTVSGAASLIAVDAYKKWILLNLITTGEVPEYPKPAFSATSRNIRALAKPYECIMEAFKSRDPSRLVAEMNEGQQVWHDDLTVGLIQEMYQAHRKYSVLHLGKTFAAIPVSQVVAMLAADQSGTPVPIYLQNLIANGEIRATLTPSPDGSDQILRFLPETVSKKSETQIELDLNSRAEQLRTLLSHISELEHRMHISKEYVEHLKKLKKNRDDENKKDAAAGGGGGTAGNKAPTNFSDFDEDMMGDEF